MDTLSRIMKPVLSLWIGAMLMALVCYYAPPAAKENGLSMPEFIAGLLSVALAILGALAAILGLIEEASGCQHSQ